MFLTHLQGKRVLTKFADDHKVYEVNFDDDGIENDACTTDEPNKYRIEWLNAMSSKCVRIITQKKTHKIDNKTVVV